MNEMKEHEGGWICKRKKINLPEKVKENVCKHKQKVDWSASI